MEINSICKPYRTYNEDAVVVVKDHLFVVIDAATALGEQLHEPTDGVYLAKALKREILELYNSGKLTPKNFEKKMNLLSQKLYKDFLKGVKNKELERYQFPNASIAVCYIDICDVHIFSIGDTSTFVRRKDDKVRYISDRSIPLMDQEVVEHYHKHGVYQFEDMYEKLRYNRSLLNKGGRRATFSLYKKANLKFKHEVFDIRDLSEVYLCTDGYYEAFDTFKIYKSRRELFSLSHDLQTVCKNIIDVAHEDKAMKKYPRLKLIDDISVIRVVF